MATVSVNMRVVLHNVTPMEAEDAGRSWVEYALGVSVAESCGPEDYAELVGVEEIGEDDEMPPELAQTDQYEELHLKAEKIAEVLRNWISDDSVRYEMAMELASRNF